MSATTVKASVLHGVRDLRLTTRELPAPPAGEVQVAVQATGLCGSDLHYFNHYAIGDIAVQEPLTLGHESSGTVVAVGEGVTDLAPGDKVALEVGMACDECEYCQAGRYNICRAMRFRSSAKIFPHAQDLGALMEPLSVALHAQARANLPPQTTVLIFGAGAVGLLAAAVTKASDAKHVIIADIQKSRVDFAVANGFADAGVVVPMARPQTIEEKLKYAKEVAEMVKTTKVDGVEVGEVGAVYECTGVETCVQASIYATKPAGRVMLIGMGNPILTLPVSAAALREVDLIGVFRYANTYPRAIKLLDNPLARMPDLTKLITQRFRGLDQIADAFGMAGKISDEKGNLVIKVFLETGN